MAVIRNPFAGQFVEDLRLLFEAGTTLGERLMPELVKLLGGPPVSYGKGAISILTARRASFRSILQLARSCGQ
jgi:Amino acid synthesis